MPTFQITGPDGKKYRVKGDTAEGAFQALQQHIGGSAKVEEQREFQGPVIPGGNLAQANYDAMPWYQQAAQAADDTARLLASGLTFGYADKLAGAIGGEGTEAERARTQQARERAGWAGTAAELTGGVAAPVGLAGRGATLMGRFGTGAMTGAKGLAARTGLAGVEGAGYGALTAAGNDQAILPGAGFGILGGFGGNLAGEGLSALGQKASRALGIARATPEERAAGQVFEAAQNVGSPQALQRLNDLGPEAMAIDVLGKRGTALARKASNLSPEAREVLESSLLGRKSGQNVRLAGDIEQAAGLAPGNRMGVDELKSAAYKNVAPKINAAYEAAREAGADLPREPFRSILETPMGQKAYEDAADSLLNRSATQGFKANSELARLDEMKRILDSKASAAYRAGDNNTGEQAASLARLLRETMDQTIAGPEYAAARGLRQQAYKTDEAFDLGAELASGRVPFGMPKKASSVADTDRKFLSQGYGAKQAENILNKGSTEGALNALSTPMAREAMEAALGGESKAVMDALARERAFNMAARDVTGNSTTARQFAEMLGTGTGVGGAAMLFGADPTTSGVAGLLAGALRKGAPAIARKIATDAEKKAAPHLAEILTRRQLPTSRPIPEGALERLSKAKRDELARILMSVGAFEAGTPSR